MPHRLNPRESYERSLSIAWSWLWGAQEDADRMGRTHESEILLDLARTVEKLQDSSANGRRLRITRTKLTDQRHNVPPPF